MSKLNVKKLQGTSDLSLLIPQSRSGGRKHQTIQRFLLSSHNNNSPMELIDTTLKQQQQKTTWKLN